MENVVALGNEMSEVENPSVHDQMLYVVERERFRAQKYGLQRGRSVPYFVAHVEWSRDPPYCPSSGLPPPRIAESFMDMLPEDLVLESLWPKLMTGFTSEEIRDSVWPLQKEAMSDVQKFQTCCDLRCVSKGWAKFVEARAEWELGLQAWIRGLHRIPYGDYQGYYGSSDSRRDSDSDEESTSDSEAYEDVPEESDDDSSGIE